MSLEPLNRVLNSLENQDSWQAGQEFQRVLKVWPEVVGAIVAAQTRPLAVERQVLKVAVSNPTWAQNLTFERQRILEKLQQKLKISLQDVRFSTGQWHNWRDRIEQKTETSQIPLWRDHPSVLPESAVAPPASTTPLADPVAAFENWTNRMQARSRSLPLCPQCQCPTPPQELQRWQTCGICAAQTFAQEKRRAESHFNA